MPMEHACSDLVPSHGKRALPYESFERKRRRVEDDDGSPAVQFLPIEDDILSILEDPDDGVPPIQDLDSVIRSFQEEIVVPPAPENASDELGFLLEASDDELGLPPSFANSAEDCGGREVSELLDISSSDPLAMTPFHGELPNYDNFDLGPEINNSNTIGKEGNGEFVMLGGLFDFSESWDVPEVMWRPESLPAV